MNTLNMYYLNLIVEALRSIDPTRLAAEGTDHGICAAVHEYVKAQALQAPEPNRVAAATIDLWYAEKDAIIRRWDKFSGDTVYPVPGRLSGHCPVLTYMDHQRNGTLWHGRQGALRCDLTAHLLRGFECLLVDALDAQRQEAQQGPSLRFSEAPDPDLYPDW